MNTGEIVNFRQLPEFVILESGKKKYNVLVSSILYIEGMSNYVKVITTGKTLVIYQRLRDLEKQLAAFDFIRIHKSYIVSLEKVDTYTSRTIEIHDKTLSIGYSYRKVIDKAFKSFAIA